MYQACATINIYFPAAAAEEAARNIVRDVRKSEQTEPAPSPLEGDKQSARIQANPVLVAFGRMLEQLIPEPLAAQADIDINTPAIGTTRSSMQRRQACLAPFLSQWGDRI